MIATIGEPSTSSYQPEPGSLLFTGADWTFESLGQAYEAIQDIALKDLGLDVYPNQIEIISAEQMLDAYASIGMPLMYQHWSFGKHFVREEMMYRKGYAGLAYEIVINSNPCISYNMEENTMPLQCLVMAHAAFGHNHFFKNNYLFKQWTDADGALDYFEFAKRYIAECEERHGIDAVEDILDAAHALMDQGVFRYKRPNKLSKQKLEQKARERQEYEQKMFSDLWRTLPDNAKATAQDTSDEALDKRLKELHLPQENLLYFLEKHSPILEGWQREILRIVRQIAQYFYPQRQTKVMNEGCATFVHHYIVNELHRRGQINDGALMEMMHSHTNVIAQPGFDDPRYNGLNPYALGFAMMGDICRIVTAPTAEDREWFPDIAGTDNWRAVLRDAWANYRDESFIKQFLSPHLMRELRLFTLHDQAEAPRYRVGQIHDDEGYHKIRNALSQQYDISLSQPDIQIVDVDLRGDRRLKLQHVMRNNIPLAGRDLRATLKLLRQLWGYDVELATFDPVVGDIVNVDTPDDEDDAATHTSKKAALRSL